MNFFYCTKELERKAFNFLFWAVPFDLSSWIFIGATAGIFTIIIRGQWFLIYAILMRQNCRILEQRKLLILFILATIIFTYGYEGIISSQLIKPPGVIEY